MKRYLIIGDVHFPFHCKTTLAAICKAVAKIKPDYIIQVGDLYDQFAFSRFPRSLNGLSPKQELTRARSEAIRFWDHLTRLAPKATCYQLIGNHDERAWARVYSAAPEIESILAEPMKELYSFDGVETLPSQRDELILNGICFSHGFRTKLGDHARENGMPTVVGHSHTGGVVYLRLKKKVIWELNAGFCANPHSAALSYTRQRQFSKWTQGYGVIDEFGPRFVPLPNP